MVADTTTARSKKKRGLGRGLDALLPQTMLSVPVSVSDHNGSESQERLVRLAIDCLQPGQYQPRREMDSDALEELAVSIEAQGIMQPLIVRPRYGACYDGVDCNNSPDHPNTPSSSAKYEIIAGERRWRAARLAGLHEVPVIVREIPDRAVIAMALIENVQREDLQPLEEAVALQRLQLEFELTQQQVAAAVGKSRAFVANMLRLLQLNPDVRKLLEHGDIEVGHAKALLGLSGSAQSQAAQKVVAGALNVRQAEALVKHWDKAKTQTQSPPCQPGDPNIRQLEEVLGNRLGASVMIAHGYKGKGKLVIRYNSLEELDGILEHIR